MTIQICCRDVAKQFISFDELNARFEYKKQKPIIVTTWLRLYQDTFGNIVTYDEELIGVLNMFDPFSPSGVKNRFVKRYTGRDGKPHEVVKLKISNEITPAERKMLGELQNNKFRLMLSIYLHKKFNSLTLYIVRCEASNICPENAVSQYKFEEEEA